MVKIGNHWDSLSEHALWDGVLSIDILGIWDVSLPAAPIECGLCVDEGDLVVVALIFVVHLDTSIPVGKPLVASIESPQ